MTSRVRSGFEKKVLKELRDAGVPHSYEALTLDYIVTKKYKPDILLLNNGIVVELKGWFKPADRTKHLAVKKAHPNADIRFVFQNPYGRLNKNSTTTYADWCNKNGFLWASKSIPKSWIEEK